MDDDVFLPILICGMLFIGLPWLIFHYVTKWKTAPRITEEDEKLLDDMFLMARRLEERLQTVERAQSAVSADEILGYDFEHVAVATGARWRADGVGRHHTYPIPLDPALPVLTPDDLMAGRLPEGGTGSYLSGLLIGHEIRSALAGPGMVHLIGATALCAFYARAIGALGGTARILDEDAAARGLARIGRDVDWN